MDGQAGIRPGKPEQRRLHLLDKETQVALLFGQQPLGQKQPLPGGLPIRLQHGARRLELGRGTSQRLEHAIVQLAGKTDAFLCSRCLLESLLQVEVIHADGHLADHNLTEHEVVHRQARFIQAEQASLNPLPLQPQGQDGPDGKSQLQIWMQGGPLDALQARGGPVDGRQDGGASIRAEEVGASEGLRNQ